MRSFRNMPIQRKLTLMIMLTSGVALLLACLAFVSYDQVMFRRAMADEMSVLTDMFDDNVAPGLTFHDAKSVEQTLHSLEAHPHILAAAVYDKAGQPVAQYRRADMTAAFPVQAGATGTEFRENRLDAFRRISLDDQYMGTIYIASDLRALAKRFWRYGIIVILVLVLSSLVAFAFSAKLQHSISGPISHLAAVAKAVATDKDYSVRAVQHNEDELGRLIQAFNGMLEEIQTRDCALQEARTHLEQRVEQRTVELREANEELRDSAARFSTVWESAHDAMRLVDEQGVTVAVNAAFCRLFGMPRSELEGAPFSMSYADHSEPAPRHEPSAKPFRIHEILPKVERRMVLRDGRMVDLEISSSVIQLPNRAALLLGLFRDVTERKRAESELREQEALGKSVLNSLHANIAVLDASATIIAVNQTWDNFARENEARAGATGVGVNYLEVLRRAHGECATEAPRALAGVQSVLNGTLDFFTMEYPCDAPNEQRWFQLNVTPLSAECGGAVLAHVNITERKEAEAQMDLMHKQLLDTSRQAGMAEVATGVLHNVGNVLNSVNVSATLLSEQAKQSKVSDLAEVVALLEQHTADMGGFITSPSGRQLPVFLAQLSRHLAVEQTGFLQETEQLRKNIEHIKDIVAMQQSYAKVSGVTETLQISDLVEDALRMNASSLTRHEVEIVREYGAVPPVTLDKHKVLQVLVNLIRNAKYACDDSGRPDKRLTLRVANEEGRLRIAVVDNGVGIPAENLTRIFNHGFTTRKEGHGFGLHSGALAAKEMGGALIVHSEGLGRGAAFTLELPC